MDSSRSNSGECEIQVSPKRTPIAAVPDPSEEPNTRDRPEQHRRREQTPWNVTGGGGGRGVDNSDVGSATRVPSSPLPRNPCAEWPCVTFFYCRRNSGEFPFEVDFGWVFDYARDIYGSAFECQKIDPPAFGGGAEMPDPDVKMLVMAGLTPVSVPPWELFRIFTHTKYKHVVITSTYTPSAFVAAAVYRGDPYQTEFARDSFRRIFSKSLYEIDARCAMNHGKMMAALYVAERRKGSGSGRAN